MTSYQEKVEEFKNNFNKEMTHSIYSWLLDLSIQKRFPRRRKKNLKKKKMWEFIKYCKKHGVPQFDIEFNTYSIDEISLDEIIEKDIEKIRQSISEACEVPYTLLFGEEKC